MLCIMIEAIMSNYTKWCKKERETYTGLFKCFFVAITIKFVIYLMSCKLIHFHYEKYIQWRQTLFVDVWYINREPTINIPPQFMQQQTTKKRKITYKKTPSNFYFPINYYIKRIEYAFQHCKWVYIMFPFFF